MSNGKKSNNKTSKITHHPKTKCPMLQIVQKQNTQDNKKPKFTKCPKLQNVQNYKMPKITKCPKLQNVQNYKMSKITKCPRL